MMTIIKGIFNLVKGYFALRKAMKFERKNTVFQLDECVTENDIIELGGETELKTEITASKEEVNLKEGLALKLLLSSLGNEDEMNKACDFIKENHLVEDYQ